MKKAELTLKFLITGVLAVFLLLVIFLNPSFMSFVAEKVPNIIPLYNNTVYPADIPELLRYDFSNDKVEFYDGLNWHVLPSSDEKARNQETKVGRKKLTHALARYNFANYYYNSERPRELRERIISLYNKEDFQEEVKKWYTQAGTWNLVRSAAPFDAIIRKISYDDKKSVVEIDLISHNYLLEEGKKQKGLSLGNLQIVQKKEGVFPVDKHIQYIYSDGKKTGIFLFVPEREIFAHIYGKDWTIYEIDKTITQIGRAKMDETRKYLIHIFRDRLFYPGQKISSFDQWFFGKGHISKEDYDVALELLNGNYYVEDLASSFYTNQILDKKIYGKFYFDHLNRLTFDKLSSDLVFLEGKPSRNIDPNNIFYQSIVPPVLEWRDLVLLNPICFCYDKDSKNCELLNVEKLGSADKIYLVVDLKKSLGKCSQK